jgi:hypothetical protein
VADKKAMKIKYLEDSMKKRSVLIPLLIGLLVMGLFLGCNQTTPLDEEGDFVLQARLVAFADKSYVGWDVYPGAAGYKLYRNVGLANYEEFGEGVTDSTLVVDNDQGEDDVEAADEYIAAGYEEGAFPEFIYYKVFAYDESGAIIAESNIASAFSHLPTVTNITYTTDVGTVNISWDAVTDDTYTVEGYIVYRYDSSQLQHQRNISLAKVAGASNTSYTVTDALRGDEWNYYIAPYDENGVSATESGGRIYADLQGPLVTQTKGTSEINITWPAVTGSEGTVASGYNVYLAYLKSGMSSSYLKFEEDNYDGTGDELPALNGSTPVTGTSFDYDYDGAGVEPFATIMASSDSRDYYFIVKAVSSEGESENYSKYEYTDPVSITKP